MDDIVIIGNDQDDIIRLKQHWLTSFQTKDLGKLKYFLGIKVAHSCIRVAISQKKCALDILSEMDMLDCKPINTLMDLDVTFLPRQGEPLVNPKRY